MVDCKILKIFIYFIYFIYIIYFKYLKNKRSLILAVNEKFQIFHFKIEQYTVI